MFWERGSSQEYATGNSDRTSAIVDELRVDGMKTVRLNGFQRLANHYVERKKEKNGSSLRPYSETANASPSGVSVNKQGYRRVFSTREKAAVVGSVGVYE